MRQEQSVYLVLLAPFLLMVCSAIAVRLEKFLLVVPLNVRRVDVAAHPMKIALTASFVLWESFLLISADAQGVQTEPFLLRLVNVNVLNVSQVPRQIVTALNAYFVPLEASLLIQDNVKPV